MAEPERRLASRIVLLPRDTNSHGAIFAGIILSYLDLAGAVEAERYAPDLDTPHQPFVTMAMRGVRFCEPVYVGDLLSFYTRTVRLGRSSVTVHVEVEATRADRPGGLVPVTQADVVYVAIDKDRRPAPIKRS